MKVMPVLEKMQPPPGRNPNLPTPHPPTPKLIPPPHTHTNEIRAHACMLTALAIPDLAPASEMFPRPSPGPEAADASTINSMSIPSEEEPFGPRGSFRPEEEVMAAAASVPLLRLFSGERGSAAAAVAAAEEDGISVEVAAAFAMEPEAMLVRVRSLSARGSSTG